MTDPTNPATDAAAAVPAGTDALLRFLLPQAGVRGVHVRLDATWRELRDRGDAAPPRATALLGQACAAAALFTGHTKVDGRLSVQLRSDGGLRALFAECTAAGTLRGIVRTDDGTDAPDDLRMLGDGAMLAITIENPGLDPREPQRYQSLVGLDAATLGGAFEGYFRQSEQLPTRLLLGARGDHVAGLLLQKLPGDTGDEDGWDRIGALFDTLAEPELLGTPGEDLLLRLFHEEAPELVGSRPLAFGCSCSRDRVASMLQSLGREEADAAAEATGVAEVKCEFCGRDYRFTRDEIADLFLLPTPQVEAPVRLQ